MTSTCDADAVLHRTRPPLAAGALRVVCAWCGAVVREGDGAGPISHGICARCAEEFVRKLEES